MTRRIPVTPRASRRTTSSRLIRVGDSRLRPSKMPDHSAAGAIASAAFFFALTDSEVPDGDGLSQPGQIPPRGSELGIPTFRPLLRWMTVRADDLPAGRTSLGLA